MTNKILDEDIKNIFESLDNIDCFRSANILLTGCGGFLGFYFLNFFIRHAADLGIKKIIGLDNFILGKPVWIESLQRRHKNNFLLYNFDIGKDDISSVVECGNAHFILHMASIASPVFYRKYPIETLDANIWGLRKLLDFFKDRDLRGFLFFSSSEVYGDPAPEYIPTSEEYRGNVAMIGPRACYDESKRFGETLCYLFAEKYDIPITICRPFNNYGPGMRLNDKRVPADFAQAIIKNQTINVFSDGTPTRTFCYISDAIIGYLKALVYGKFEVFNIGIERPEISIRDLADIYRTIGKNLFNYDQDIIFSQSLEKNYLRDNPNRRCPNISKARNLLNYHPTITVQDGVARFLKYLAIEVEKETV